MRPAYLGAYACAHPTDGHAHAYAAAGVRRLSWEESTALGAFDPTPNRRARTDRSPIWKRWKQKTTKITASISAFFQWHHFVFWYGAFSASDVCRLTFWVEFQYGFGRAVGHQHAFWDECTTLKLSLGASVWAWAAIFVCLCLRFTTSTRQKRILVLNPGRNKAERKCLKKGRNVGKGCEVKRPRFYFTRLGGEIVVALGGHFVFCHRVWSFSILWTSEPSSWQFEGDRVIIT